MVVSNYGIRDTTDASILFWVLIDMIIPITFLFTLASLKGFRSYLRIDQEGFEYREEFRSKKYHSRDIENIYREDEFVFVKCKNKKIPLIIEKGYGDQETIYRMLCTLKER